MRPKRPHRITRLVAAASSVIVMLSVLVLAPTSPAAAHTAASAPNLIANASVESAESPTKPVSWASNSWGANSASFSYPQSGADGVRSVRTDITSWADGDAKWFFDPVPVTPMTEYSFHDHYRSDVTTSMVARFTLDDGAFVYEWLGDVGASSDWAVASGRFTAPPNAMVVTVFHVIASVGFLTIDDAYLGESEPEPEPPSTSLVPNDSLEQAAANNPGAPAKWFTNSWGSNSASFEYVNEGNTGSRSVKTTVTNYASGDAKWWFEPVAIEAGKDYTFADAYKSSVATSVYAVFFDAANVPSYVQLEAGLAPSPAGWQAVERTFTAPAGAVKLTIYHVVDGNGWLQIDDLTVNEAAPPPPPPPPPTDGNLILNPSLESGSISPQAWRTNAWGQNTASFTYETSGRTGTRSVTTVVSSYSNGDAKWYFDPVAVEGGGRYEYAHHYISDVTTEAVAQFTHDDGSLTYGYLGSVPASADWAEAEFSIVVPATARALTVFHVVASAGRLTIDDAFLGVAEPMPVDDGLLPNASLEVATGGHPIGWLSESWGSNTSTFEYVDEGRTGNRSVKVTVDNYISGDGKWLFEPIELPRGEQFRFGVWYRTNTVPHAVAMFTKDNGQVEYYGLPDPQPSGSTSEWQHYSDTFTMPVDAVSASVFLFVSNNGWVQTDDYSITPYQSEGFARPLVTLTFDDGHEDNVTTALPLLESYGFDTTQCYATTYIEDAPNEQAAIAGVLAFRDAGHEICSHTVTHPFLTQLSPAQADFELAHSQSYLQSITGDAIPNFASPYGDHNEAVNAQIAQYYRSHRTVNEGFNSKDNFDIYRLRVQNMLSTTTLQEFQSWLDTAAETNTWLIIVYHRVANDPGTYDVHTTNFAQQMAALSGSGLTVKTMQAALDEVVPQVAG